MEQRRREAREKEEEIESERARGNEIVKGRRRRGGQSGERVSEWGEGERRGVLAHLGKQ